MNKWTIIIVIAMAGYYCWFTSNSSIKFVDEQGTVCGCMVDRDIPTLSQCDRLTDLLETITVSSCE